MDKKQYVIFIIICNMGLIIPTTLFTLAIFEGYKSLSTLYMDLGFASIFYLMFVALLNGMLVSFKEEMLKK